MVRRGSDRDRPNSALSREDLVACLLEGGGQVQAVQIVSSTPLAADSRTYTVSENGTFGQTVPLIGLEALPDADLIVPMLEQTASRRTNLGLVNHESEPIDATIELLDERGALLDELEQTVPAGQLVQLNRVLGARTVARAWARVRFDGGRGFAWASVVDNATGDPVFVPATDGSDRILLIPAAAHASGLEGTSWRSDLEILNPGLAPAAYRVFVLDGAATAISQRFELAAGALHRHEDVVGRLFDRSGSVALQVVPEGGELVVSSRTWTPSGAGSVGQLVRAIEVEELVDEWLLAGVGRSSDFRTNLGLVNPSWSVVVATVQVLNAWGEALSEQQVEIEGRSLKILLDLALPSAARVLVRGEHGAVLNAWASVVDRRSGVAELVPGTPLS